MVFDINPDLSSHLEAHPHKEGPGGMILVANTVGPQLLQQLHTPLDIPSADMIQRQGQLQTGLRIIREGRLQDGAEGLAV